MQSDTALFCKCSCYKCWTEFFCRGQNVVPVKIQDWGKLVSSLFFSHEFGKRIDFFSNDVTYYMDWWQPGHCTCFEQFPEPKCFSSTYAPPLNLVNNHLLLKPRWVFFKRFITAWTIYFTVILNWLQAFPIHVLSLNYSETEVPPSPFSIWTLFYFIKK